MREEPAHDPMERSVLDLVRDLLHRLAADFAFTVEERPEENGVLMGLSPWAEGAGEVLIQVWDRPMTRGEPVPIELGSSGAVEIVGDRERRWVTKLDDLLYGVMANGFTVTVLRLKRWKWAGPLAGVRVEIPTRSGSQVFYRGLFFWPLTRALPTGRALPTEVVRSQPYSLRLDG